MRSKKPDAASSTSSVGRVLPTICSRSGIAAASNIQVSSPYCCLSRFETALISRLACSIVTPSATRAIAIQL